MQEKLQRKSSGMPAVQHYNPAAQKAVDHECAQCGATKTPQWREGPLGKSCWYILIVGMEENILPCPSLPLSCTMVFCKRRSASLKTMGSGQLGGSLLLLALFLTDLPTQGLFPEIVRLVMPLLCEVNIAVLKILQTRPGCTNKFAETVAKHIFLIKRIFFPSLHLSPIHYLMRPTL